jgi:DNA-binding MarR family transcriptional regulator
MNDVRVIDDDEVLSTLDCVWSLDHALEGRSREMLARSGVTAPQRFVLRQIARDEGLTMGTLARRMHHHPSTLTPLLKRLHANGWIERRGDSNDLRRVRVFLTESGRAVTTQSEGTVEEAVAQALSHMSASDAAQLRVALRLLAAHVGVVQRDNST